MPDSCSMGIEAAMTFTSSRYGWPTLLSACIKSADDARAAAIVRWCYDLSPVTRSRVSQAVAPRYRRDADQRERSA
jgi:hypothetical protein